MSHEIDERIVSMKFENEEFEAGIKQSEQSVHSFNDTLNSMGRGQALNGIAVNVAAISDRFSALGIIGKRVLENLTDSAMALISKTGHAVTDSIVQGGIRRAMNIENAHFQLQGLLKDEEKVQAVMADAMDSVDGTAYAYDSAAKAAAQFAASGLEAGPELQAALRGITGVAAMTSSEYENISEIFTTVAGNGRLMSMQLLQMSSRGLNAAATIRDFFNGVNDGSIQANDNVTALVKSISKGAKVSEADIRDFVTKGKISFDIFSAAMDNAFGEHAKKANETLTGALSNVKSALARIGAEFISPLVVQNGPIVQLLNALRERINDVKKAITPLAKMFTDAVSAIAASATKYLQNLDVTAPIERMVASFQKLFTFVKSLNTLGALQNLAEGISFTFRGLGHVIDTFGESFKSVFSGPTLYSVTKFAEAFKNLGVAFDVKILQHMSQLKDIFTGLFSGVHIFTSAISAALKALGSVVSFIAPAGNAVLDFAAAIGRSVTALDQFLTKNKIFEKFFTDIGSVLRPAAEKIKSLIGDIVDGFKSFGNIDDSAFEGFSKIGEKLNGASDGFSKFFEVIKTVGGAALNALGQILTGLGAGLHGFLQNITLTDAVVSVLLSKAALNIKRFTYKLKPLSVMKDTIVGILNNTRSALLGFTRDLNAKALTRIAAAIALLAVALIGISSLDAAKLATSLVGIGALLAELYAFMVAFTKLQGSLKGFSAASVSLVAMGLALLEVAGAMKIISSMSWEGIVKGLVGIAGALTVLTAALNAMPAGAKMLAIGPAMIAISAALVVLAGALKLMGSMNMESIGRSLLVLGGALAELAIGLHAMNGTLSGSAALVVAAAALLALAPALKILGTMDNDAIVHSLVALAGALMVLSVAAKAMEGSTASMMMVSASLGVLGASLMVFGPALKILGTISWESIAKGLVVIAGAFTVLGVAGKLLGSVAPQMILVSAALGVLGAALLIFTPGLAALGKLSIETIAKGLLALAGTFAVLGVAAAVLAPLTPIILALSVAIGVFGASVLAVGAGVALFGAGLTALAALTAPAMESIGNALKTVIGVIPEFATAMATGLVNVLQVLAENAPQVVSAIMTLLGELISQLGTLIPQMAEVGLQMIVALLTAVRDHINEIVDLGMEIIVGFLQGIRDHIRELVDVGLEIITGIIQGIGDNIQEIVTEAGHVVAEFIRGLGESAKDIMSAGADFIRNLGQGIRENISVIGEFIGDIIAGFIEAVDAESSRIITAGKDLIIHFIEGIGSATIEIANAATDVIVAFCEALGKNSALIMWAVSNLFKQIKSAFAEYFPTLASFLGIEAEEVSWEIPEGLRRGVEDKTPTATGAVDTLGGKIQSKLEGLIPGYGAAGEEGGAAAPTGTAEGIEANTGVATTAAESMGSSVESTIEAQGPKYNAAGDTSGGETGKGTASGIDNSTSTATRAANNFGNSVKGVIEGIGTKLKTAGESAGKQAGAGLAAGISSMRDRVVTAASNIASAASAIMSKVLDINSPSKVTMGIGRSFTEGFAMGITELAPTAEKSSVDLSKRVIDSAKKFLQINSPSKVAKDEIGRYIVEGIAEGITENTSAEEAAAKKAQNIVDAFKTELEKADLKQTIYSLENDIWSALNPDANDDIKNKKALAQTMRELETQTERVNLLLGRVKVTKDEFGEDSEEYTTAYVEFMREIKTYAEAISGLKSLAKDLNKNQTDTNKAIILWSLSHQDQMEIMKNNLKMSDQEIREFIKDKIGATDDSYISMVNAAVSDYENFIGTMNKALSEGNLALMDQFKAGTKYAEILADAVTESGKKVSENADTVANSSVKAIEDKSQDMKDAGAMLMDSIVWGIKDKSQSVVDEAKKVANSVKDAVTGAFNSTTTKGQNGPSSVYTSNGTVYAGASNTNSLATKVSTFKAAETATIMTKDIKVVADTGASTTNVTYNLTQNNTSPKALSNAEIYRQTKTLFGQTKASTDVIKGVAVSA